MRIGLVDGAFDLAFAAARAGRIDRSVGKCTPDSHVQDRSRLRPIEIWLRFAFTAGTAPVQVSRSWVGFAALFGPLNAAFPTLAPEWYTDVSEVRAFEAKHRVLYDASPSHTAAVV